MPDTGGLAAAPKTAGTLTPAVVLALDRECAAAGLLMRCLSCGCACAAGLIARNLDLNRPRYKRTAAYGHFGREPISDFTWEKVIDLKAKVKA